MHRMMREAEQQQKQQQDSEAQLLLLLQEARQGGAAAEVDPLAVLSTTHIMFQGFMMQLDDLEHLLPDMVATAGGGAAAADMQRDLQQKVCDDVAMIVHRLQGAQAILLDRRWRSRSSA